MNPPRITRARVLDATFELASESGLGAVTMRAVAARLGVTPMALYRHVGDKAGLLDGLVERLMGEVARTPGPDGDWRVRLRALADNMRATARRHPDLFVLLFQRRALTDGAVVAREEVHDALRLAGVPEGEVPRLERMVSTYMLGFAASEAGGRFAGLDADAEFDHAEELLSRLVEFAAAEPPARDSGLAPGRRRQVPG
ncbi:TetR family transcriptional regulator [Streptomyces sp. NPDC008150]|uniref:TetR/AcrR family transcriptional regulator n=1 Tax=Streptomyces sp. NPDC008150 TaxID=3364816 RepID=UPI0036E8DA88